MGLVFSQDYDGWSGNQFNGDPYNKVTDYPEIHTSKSGGSLQSQWNIIAAPWGGKCAEIKLAPGQFDNAPRGRCEWTKFAPWNDHGLDGIGGYPRFSDSSELYFAFRIKPPANEPGDSNLFQIKPGNCLNQYNSPPFSLKYAGGMTQLRVQAAGGIPPFTCTGTAQSGVRQWSNFYGASGTIQLNKVNDFVWRVKLSSLSGGTAAQDGSVTVWARYLDLTNPNNATAYEKIIDVSGFRLGWVHSDGRMPPHYLRGGLYALVDSSITYTTLQDNVRIGETFADVTSVAVTPPPSPPPATPGVLPALPAGKVRYGNSTVGVQRVGASADKKRVSRVLVDQQIDVDKIYVHIEGSAAGTQIYRAIVYANDGLGGDPGTRKIQGFQKTKTVPFSPLWEENVISPVVRLDSSTTVWAGIITGPTANVINYAYDVVASAGRNSNDTESDGASDPFVVSPETFAAPIDRALSIVIEGTPVVPPQRGGRSRRSRRPRKSRHLLLASLLFLRVDDVMDILGLVTRESERELTRKELLDPFTSRKNS